MYTVPNSVLFLGRPGVGKTTVIREMARILSDDLKKRVVRSTSTLEHFSPDKLHLQQFCGAGWAFSGIRCYDVGDCGHVQ